MPFPDLPPPTPVCAAGQRRVRGQQSSQRLEPRLWPYRPPGMLMGTVCQDLSPRLVVLQISLKCIILVTKMKELCKILKNYESYQVVVYI